MKAKGFTLIELLVVMGLIAVLFVLAIPTFENAGRRDINRPAQQFASTLRFARQAAIVRRQWTLLVIPARGSPFPSADINKCLRSYAVLAVTNMHQVKKETKFESFKKTFLSDWKILPDGVYFDENPEHSTPFQHLVTGSMKPARPDDTTTKMAAILFEPNGQVNRWNGSRWANDKFNFYLLSSIFYDTSGSGETASLNNPVSLSTGTNVMIKIGRQRGTVSIEPTTGK